MRKGQRRQRRHAGRAWEERSVRHARGRLGERYGIHLTEPAYWEVVRAIQERRGARQLYRQDRRTTWWLVTVPSPPASPPERDDSGGVKCIAIYNAYLRRVQTFLGLDALSDIGLTAEDVA